MQTLEINLYNFKEINLKFSQMEIKTEKDYIKYIEFIIQTGQLFEVVEIVKVVDITKYYTQSDIIKNFFLDEIQNPQIKLIWTNVFEEEYNPIPYFNNTLNIVPTILRGKEKEQIIGLHVLRTILYMPNNSDNNKKYNLRYVIEKVDKIENEVIRTAYGVVLTDALIELYPDLMVVQKESIDSMGHYPYKYSLFFSKLAVSNKDLSILYQNKIRTCLKITNNFKDLNMDYRKTETFDNKRIAICITGSARGDITLPLLSIKHKIELYNKEGIEVDIYIAPWDKEVICTGSNHEEWLKGTFINHDRHVKMVPDEIKNINDFKKKFPNTSEKILKRYCLLNDSEIFETIFSGYNYNLKFLDESSFDYTYDKYDEMKFPSGNPDIILLNQSKQAYALHEVLNMCFDSGKDYDYILRTRVDYNLTNVPSYEEMNKLKSDFIVVTPTPLVGVADGLFMGSSKVMYKLMKMWEYIRDNKSYSMFLHDGKLIRHHAEAFTYDYLINFDIKMSSHAPLHFQPIFLLRSSIYRVLDFDSALNKDLQLNNFTEEEIAKYRRFFVLFNKYNIKHNKRKINEKKLIEF